MGYPESVPSAYNHALPAEVEDAFIVALAAHGSVVRACHDLGLSRATMYHRRHRDADFAARWVAAIANWRSTFEESVLLTAAALGTGRWVQETDPKTGEPIFDCDPDDWMGERPRPRMRFEVSGVDARVTNKLLDKLMPSADGPNHVSVGVQAAGGPQPITEIKFVFPDRVEDADEIQGEVIKVED